MKETEKRNIQPFSEDPTLLCSWGALGPSPSVPFTEEPASNWSSGPKKTRL